MNLELESKAALRTYKIYSTGHIPVGDVLVEVRGTPKHIVLKERWKQEVIIR
jgi:hypothetical protein